jgi:hypothetical protein
MTQLEFYRVHDERAIAHAWLHEPQTIPNIGDCIYVPNAQESCAYVYVEVARRQFYYDQQGYLTTVRLTCDSLLDGEIESCPRGGMPSNAHSASHGHAEAERFVLHLRCPRCGYYLTFHQPDPELEDRLLATCEECKSWYLANPGRAALSSIC